MTLEDLPDTSAARDNARRGTWMMNEQFNGWVLLGADRKPVMRNDRSRVGFRFADAVRLAGEPPDTRGAAHDLAPLDAGFNGDWDPEVPQSYLADLTKMVKLLAYHHVQTTEPQEAVRRAVSDIFGHPVYVDEPGTNAWVPGKFDLAAVKATAAALMGQALGPEPDDGQGGDAFGGMAASGERMVRGMPRDRRNLGTNFVKAAATSEQANPTNSEMQVVQAGQTQSQQGEFGGPKVERGKNYTIRTSEPKPPVEQPQSVINALENDEFSQAWFDQLATTWETKGRRFDGYGTSLADRIKGVEGFALGRYQMRRPGLIDAGMMNRNGQWTNKYGIKSWQEFMNNPQAQEAAGRDLLRANERYMRKLRSQNIGRIIKSAEGDIMVTEGGFLAACHKAGIGGMGAYSRWVEANGWDTRGKALPDAFHEIEPRMKQFENTSHRRQ